MMTLGELLGCVACDLEAYAAVRGVRVEPRAEGFALLAAEPHRLREALSRLLQAAIERSCAGATVQARAAVCGGKAVFVVEDESPLPFVGGHLGISIARAIIERHGGRLRIKGTDGFGASMRAELPCLGAEPEEQTP
jgi:signal transduction histidine kinase